MKRVKLLLTAFALFIAMGTPNVMAQGTKVSQPSINLVGKWLWPNPKFYFEFSSDGTGTYRVHQGKEYKLGDTEYTYVVEAWLLYINWKLEGDELKITCTKTKRVVGDCSFYPVEYQKQIKAVNDSLDNLNNQKWANGIDVQRLEYKIISFAPASIKLKEGDNEYVLTRDVSGMSPQEQEQYKKEIAQWEKIKKEKEQAEYKAALERDNLQMAKLKMKAVRTGDQYDYWIIGHMYEFGEGNDGAKTTICLDSALVWYKKAAAIDPSNQIYVTAVTHKMKTGGDYYQDKAKETVANAKNAAKKLGSKYGATLVNNLINTGQIKVGTPLALLQELIPIVNRTISRDADYLQLRYFEPTTRDMQQYGKTAKRVKITDSFNNYNLRYSLMIANGKVAAVYQQSTWLKIN